MRSVAVRWVGVAICVVLSTAACASEPTPAAPAITVRETAVATTNTTPAATIAATIAATTFATDSITTDDTGAATTAVAGDTVVPEGFDRVAATVTMADGTICELCLWLAASGDQRSQGLMSVTDLGGADGMAFLYESPHSGAFWMKNTLLPLSIGFYAADGAFLDAFDMEPCTADPCPNYPTPDDFLVAIETYQGGLAELGIRPGSTLALSDLPCT